MDYIQVNEYSRLYEFDPNKKYNKNSILIEERIFCRFLEQYGWEKFKREEYNSGKNHIYVILDYKREKPEWVGFMHVLECNGISKRCIQKIYFLEDKLFSKKVVFIHTIDVQRPFRRQNYASYMVEMVRKNFGEKADLMVEATKKGKKFWPAVGFCK